MIDHNSKKNRDILKNTLFGEEKKGKIFLFPFALNDPDRNVFEVIANSREEALGLAIKKAEDFKKRLKLEYKAEKRSKN